MRLALLLPLLFLASAEADNTMLCGYTCESEDGTWLFNACVDPDSGCPVPDQGVTCDATPGAKSPVPIGQVPHQAGCEDYDCLNCCPYSECPDGTCAAPKWEATSNYTKPICWGGRYWPSVSRPRVEQRTEPIIQVVSENEDRSDVPSKNHRRAFSPFSEAPEVRDANQRHPQAWSGHQDKRSLKWRHPSNGKVVWLDYDVKHAPNTPVKNLDFDDGVLSVRCPSIFASSKTGTGQLQITTNSDADASRISAQILNATVVAGGRRWNCVLDGHTKLFLFRAIESASVNGSTVRVDVMRAWHHELFESASISFRAEAFPEQHILEVAHPLAERDLNAGGRHLLDSESGFNREPEVAMGPGGAVLEPFDFRLGGWFSDLCDWAWGEVQHVAEDVEQAVEAVTKTVKAIVTGDYTYDDRLTLDVINWNYDGAGGAVNKSIPLFTLLNHTAVCSNCYADFNVGLNFDLNIADYTLQTLDAYVDGDLEINLEAIFELGELEKSWTGNTTIATIVLPEVDFTVGAVPFSIDTSIPIVLGFALEAKASVSLKSFVKATGSGKWGAVYTQQDGFHSKNEHNFTHSGDILSLSADAKISAQIYTLPTLVFQIDHIGGPNIGLKGYLEAEIEYQSEGSPCNASGGAGVHGSLNWGLQATIGAHIDVELGDQVLYKDNWGPKVLLANKFPIKSGCLKSGKTIELGDLGHVLDEASVPFPSMVYTGQIIWKDTPDCSNLPPTTVTLQIRTPANTSAHGVEFGPQPRFSVVSSSHYDRTMGANGQGYNVACSNLSPYKNGQGVPALAGASVGRFPRQIALTLDDVPELQFQHCIEPDYQPMSPEGSGIFDPDFNALSLSITDSEHCLQSALLYRSGSSGRVERGRTDVQPTARSEPTQEVTDSFYNMTLCNIVTASNAMIKGTAAGPGTKRSVIEAMLPTYQATMDKCGTDTDCWKNTYYDIYSSQPGDYVFAYQILANDVWAVQWSGGKDSWELQEFNCTTGASPRGHLCCTCGSPGHPGPYPESLGSFCNPYTSEKQ